MANTAQTDRQVVRPGQEQLATLIEHVNANVRTARQVQIIFAVLLGFAYALLFSITHRQLFLNEAVRLPILNLIVPLNLFFIVAPMLVVLLHFTLLQRHVVLAGQLRALARHEDFSALRVEPLLSGNFFVQRRAGRRRGWLFGFLLWLREWLLFYGLPAILLVLLLWRLLPFHDERITWIQRVVLWFDLAIMVIFAILIRRPEGPMFTRRWPSCATWVGLLLAYVAALLVLFLNVPHGGVAGRGGLERFLLQTQSCFPMEVGSGKQKRQACWLTAVLTEWVPDFFRRNLAVVNEDLVPDSKWEPENEPSLRLAGRDIRYADLHGTDLHRIKLSNAKLQSADLGGGNLQGADLSGANLQGANLTNADMRATWLDSAKIWMTTWPKQIDSTPTILGIRLVATLHKKEKAVIRKLLEQRFMKHNEKAATRLRALLDPQQRQSWKKTEYFKRWQQHAGTLAEGEEQLLLRRHGKIRAGVLCSLPKRIRNKNIQILAEFLGWPPSAEYVAAYIWQLCLKDDKGAISDDEAKDARIRHVFQQAARALLPQESAQEPANP